jgi:hypothetical protein
MWLCLPHAFSVQWENGTPTQGGVRCARWPWAILPCTFGAKNSAARFHAWIGVIAGSIFTVLGLLMTAIGIAAIIAYMKQR